MAQINLSTEKKLMDLENGRRRIYICMCDWVTLLYGRKSTEYCKPTIMEKIKIIFKKISQITVSRNTHMHILFRNRSINSRRSYL